MTSLAHPAYAVRAEAAEVPRGSLRTAAGLALVPAVAGLALAPSRFAAWWGYGVLSAVAAVALLALAARLFAGRSDRWTLQAGVWGALALIVGFVVTHTAGIPVGPAR